MLVPTTQTEKFAELTTEQREFIIETMRLIPATDPNYENWFELVVLRVSGAARL